MAKYWTAGEVKTRLGKSIGIRKSALIHQEFVSYLARALKNAGDRRVFAVAPADRLDEFRAALPTGWETTPQAGGDLGNRLRSFFADSLAPHDETAIASVVIGADCPTLNQQEIEVAFTALKSHHAVLGPATDGGYYLIGLRSPWCDDFDQLFLDIPWSSENVYQITMNRMQQIGLRPAILPSKEDIDTIAELDRLRAQLAASTEQTGRELLTIIESILAEPES